MSTLSEKPTSEAAPASTNILTITRPSPTRQPSSTPSHNPPLAVLSTIDSASSTHSLSPTRTSRSDTSNEKAHIMSHSPTHSPPHSAAGSKTNINAPPTSIDLEMGLTPLSTQSQSRKNPLIRGKSGVDPYPCRAAQKRMRREQKLARAKCACWANMNKTKRKVIVVVGLLALVAVITVMAVFISKATGSGVYGKQGQTNAPIS